MKKVKILLFFTGKILSIIYPISLHKKITSMARSIINRIYSAWLSRSFKDFGSNSLIARPCILVGEKYISIQKNVYIDKNAVLTAWDKHGENEVFSPFISIGNNTNIGEYSHISAINKIEIGENVLTGRWLTIVDNAHGAFQKNMLEIAPSQRPLYSKGIVRIGSGVWIGDKVSITAGVTIGNNSIIGANTVVTKDIPEYSLAVGNPMRIIKISEKKN